MITDISLAHDFCSKCKIIQFAWPFDNLQNVNISFKDSCLPSQTADISKCDSYIEGLKENCKNLHKCEYYFLQAICIDRCAGKHVKVNKKVLDIYMEIQPQITKKRMDEMATL